MSRSDPSDLAARVGDALLAARSDAILATDRDGTIRLWNPGAERIFGFTAAEAVGQSLDIIVPESLRDRHWQGWAQAVAAGRSRYGEGELLSVPALTRDGLKISVEFTIVMLCDAAGRVDGVAALLRDATERYEEIRRLKRELAAWNPKAY